MNENDDIPTILITLPVISVIAMMANIAEMIFLMKKRKTLHICLLLMLCITDFRSSLSLSIFIVLFGTKTHTLTNTLSVLYQISHRIIAERKKVKTLVLVSVWSISTITIGIFSIIIKYLNDTTRIIQIICCVFIFVISLSLAIIYMLIIRKIFRQTVPKPDTEIHSQLRTNHGRSIKDQNQQYLVYLN